MDDLNELVKNFDTENYKYFYHITEHGRGEQILEEGLFMENKHLYSTTIEVPDEMISAPNIYCKSEYCGRLNIREEMVIIECMKDEEKYLVKKGDKSIWNLNQSMKYVIPSEYILCYIDLENLEVTYNYNRQFDNTRRM